jgi:short-subunit dehydrogenase
MDGTHLNGSGLVILVTGCNSGIGAALTRRLYSEGDYRVVVTARAKSVSSLRETFEESDRFLIRELDVTDDKCISNLTAEIYLRWRRIDVLINNAGICYRSVIEHMDEESELHQLRTNYLGPMSLVRAVLPAMRERGFGHIINISSASGMLAMPTMGSYSASKAALQSASEALWYELRPYGVRVSIVQPGFVNSKSFQNIYMPKKAQLCQALEAPYSQYYSSFSNFVEKLMHLSHATPDKIAERIVWLIQEKNPPLWAPVSADIHFFNFLRHVLPQGIFHYIMFKMLPNSKAWLPKLPILPTIAKDL